MGKPLTTISRHPNIQILYKMKYWRGVNFGNWQLLDKIANILSTNNNYVIKLTCHFLITTGKLNGITAVLKEDDIPKVSLYQS